MILVLSGEEERVPLDSQIRVVECFCVSFDGGGAQPRGSLHKLKMTHY